MARRKTTKNQSQTIILEMPSEGGWLRRLEKISKQTGLSPTSLLQKWILQEETLIGLMRLGGERPAEEAEEAETSGDEVPQTPPAAWEDDAEAVLPSDGSDYRRTLRDRAAALRNEGMAISRIAKTFNDENISTVSGSGKWYSSSITNLLKSDLS